MVEVFDKHIHNLLIFNLLKRGKNRIMNKNVTDFARGVCEIGENSA